MQVAINLTPVLVTLIICVCLYAMCNMARQDKEKEKQQKEIEVPEFMNHRNNMHIVTKDYVEDQAKKGDNKQ